MLKKIASPQLSVAQWLTPHLRGLCTWAPLPGDLWTPLHRRAHGAAQRAPRLPRRGLQNGGGQTERHCGGLG